MTLQQMQKTVSQWVEKLDPKTIILLNGPLGVGKTQFVNFLVAALGGEKTSSPTFAIHNVYPVAQTEVHHLDLYRLENEEDLESTGFWDLFSMSQGVIAIEWAEKIKTEFLPRDWTIYQVNLDFHSDEHQRVLEIVKQPWGPTFDRA